MKKFFLALLGLVLLAAFGGTLAAFETMWPDFYHLGTTALDQACADTSTARLVKRFWT